MFGRYLGKVLLLAAIVLLSGLFCVGAGLIPTRPIACGNSVLFGLSVVLTLFIVVVALLCACFIWLACESGSARTGSFVIIITGCVCACVPSVHAIRQANQQAAFHRSMTEKMQAFALSRFDEIDANHDGTITDEELGQAIERLPLSDDEREALEYMKAKQSDIGHVLSHTTTTKAAAGCVGTGSGLIMVPLSTTEHVYVYGISRDEITEYGDRVTRKYKQW